MCWARWAGDGWGFVLRWRCWWRPSAANIGGVQGVVGGGGADVLGWPTQSTSNQMTMMQRACLCGRRGWHTHTTAECSWCSRTVAISGFAQMSPTPAALPSVVPRSNLPVGTDRPVALLVPLLMRCCGTAACPSPTPRLPAPTGAVPGHVPPRTEPQQPGGAAVPGGSAARSTAQHNAGSSDWTCRAVPFPAHQDRAALTCRAASRSTAQQLWLRPIVLTGYGPCQQCV